MPDYRRNRVPGGTYFFTANLLNRASDLLVARIEVLRAAVQTTRARAPFHIDAWVVLPDHMHCIWTLPPDDDDYSGRWRALKKHSPRRYRRVNIVPPPVCAEPNAAYGSGASGNTPFETTATTRRIWTMSISIR